MKRFVILLFVFALLLGCAAKKELAEGRNDNEVIYAMPNSEGFVTVAVGGGYAYEGPVDKSFMGLDVEGYLFKSGNGCRMLVTRLPRDGFEDLIGRKIGAPAAGTKVYEPRTAYLDRLCRLARFYVVSLGSEVVVAMQVKSFRHGETCLGWSGMEELTARNPGMIEEFDRDGDEAVTIQWH